MGGDGIYESVGRCNFGGGRSLCFEKDERKRKYFFFLEIFGFDAVCTGSLFFFFGVCHAQILKL